ncbi:MAG TPA: hypothetical protein VG898_12450 [Solirubrobacterales bacterium]|nr:hypothetical protein [Solirubrobacterales bacterium]
MPAPRLNGKFRISAGFAANLWNILAHYFLTYLRTKGLRMNEESTLSGWWVFAGVLLLVAGVLNIIWGIAAIGDSKFFTEHGTFIISGLHTWGWITLILGVLELVAAFSLFSGGEFGRWFGIFIAALNAMGALLSIPAYPFWSLAIFALSIIIVYKLAEGPEGSVTG